MTLRAVMVSSAAPASRQAYVSSVSYLRRSDSTDMKPAVKWRFAPLWCPLIRRLRARRMYRRSAIYGGRIPRVWNPRLNDASRRYGVLCYAGFAPGVRIVGQLATAAGFRGFETRG